KRGTSWTTAWLKFRHIRSARWIINLLIFPSDNTVFHKHFPAARSCAVYAMCSPNYFVMGPALPIHIFPIAVFLFSPRPITFIAFDRFKLLHSCHSFHSPYTPSFVDVHSLVNS